MSFWDFKQEIINYAPFFPFNAPSQVRYTQESDRRGAKYLLPLMLDLIAGFNAHPFAQKIKLAHPETTGQMHISPQRQEAHQLEEEEEMKRENCSVLQRVHPGKRKGEKS